MSEWTKTRFGTGNRSEGKSTPFLYPENHSLVLQKGPKTSECLTYLVFENPVKNPVKNKTAITETLFAASHQSLGNVFLVLNSACSIYGTTCADWRKPKWLAFPKMCSLPHN